MTYDLSKTEHIMQLLMSSKPEDHKAGVKLMTDGDLEHFTAALIRQMGVRLREHADKEEKLADLVKVQRNLHGPGGYKDSSDDPLVEYHRGMLNGMLVAESVFTGGDPSFERQHAGGPRRHGDGAYRR